MATPRWRRPRRAAAHRSMPRTRSKRVGEQRAAGTEDYESCLALLPLALMDEEPNESVRRLCQLAATLPRVLAPHRPRCPRLDGRQWELLDCALARKTAITVIHNCSVRAYRAQ